MLEGKRILVVAAHPDDETLGAGGTITKYAKNIKVIWAVKRIHHSARIAMARLNVTNYEFGRFKDQLLDVTPLKNIADWVKKYIDDYKPDIILTHTPFDVNQDHKRVYEATKIATRFTNITILCWEEPSSTEFVPGFHPNLYVNLGYDHIDRKLNAMNDYQSELRKERCVVLLSTKAVVRGAEASMPRAEAFMIDRCYDVL